MFCNQISRRRSCRAPFGLGDHGVQRATTESSAASPVRPALQDVRLDRQQHHRGLSVGWHQRLDAACRAMPCCLRDAVNTELPHPAAQQARMSAADRQLPHAASRGRARRTELSRCARPTSTPGPLNNVAVPGATSLSPTGAVPGPDTLVENALTTFILGGETQVQRAAEAQPTFVSAWIGNNDVLERVAHREFFLRRPAISNGVTSLRHVHDELQESREGAARHPVDQGRRADWRRQHGERAAALSGGSALRSNGQGCIRSGRRNDDGHSIRRPAPPTTTSLINFQLAGAIRAGTHPPTIFCEALPAPFRRSATSTCSTPRSRRP